MQSLLSRNFPTHTSLGTDAAEKSGGGNGGSIKYWQVRRANPRPNPSVHCMVSSLDPPGSSLLVRFLKRGLHFLETGTRHSTVSYITYGSQSQRAALVCLSKVALRSDLPVVASVG